MAGPALTGEIAEPDAPPVRLREAVSGADPVAAPPADPVERMRALIAGRQTETLEILRGWMDEREPGGADGRATDTAGGR